MQLLFDVLVEVDAERSDAQCQNRILPGKWALTVPDCASSGADRGVPVGTASEAKARWMSQLAA
jgi:hypothetical protein